MDVVNVCIAKQMVRWFHCNMGIEAYLGVIRLVKSEVVDIIPEVSKGKEVGDEVEKTFHPDMPSRIKEALNEFKDIFPTDLPPSLPPV